MRQAEPILIEELEQELDPVCVRLVRQLRHSARRVVAFVSATEGVPTARFLVQLGVAARLVTGERVTLVDPGRRWPEVHAKGAPMPPREADLFEEERVADGVSVLRPFEEAPPGARGQLLELLLAHGRQEKGRVFVDLSEPGRVGEFLGTTSLLDGVVVLGVVGRTTERELEELCSQVPASVDLGVVLLA